MLHCRFSKKGSRSSALQSKQSVDSTAQGPSQAGASHTAQGNSASPSCASRTGKLGETGKEAGGGGACDPEVMLNKMKSVLKAGTADREESKFPSGVLRGAESRVARSKAASATFMNRWASITGNSLHDGAAYTYI